MRVLVVDAHADDGEISAGGTIARLIREGHEVRSVYFCPCTEDPQIVGHVEEHKKACKVLGIKEVIEFNYPRDSYLEARKHEIRDALFKIRELYKPDLVLCPSIKEFHQDHKAVAECCVTIFRDTSTILGFEVMRSSTPDFTPNFYVILSSEDYAIKLRAIEEYKIQMKLRPYFFTVEKFIAQMRFRGAQAKTDYAEAFELMWGRI